MIQIDFIKNSQTLTQLTFDTEVESAVDVVTAVEASLTVLEGRRSAAGSLDMRPLGLVRESQWVTRVCVCLGYHCVYKPHPTLRDNYDTSHVNRCTREHAHVKQLNRTIRQL